jgi:TonB family protein
MSCTLCKLCKGTRAPGPRGATLMAPRASLTLAWLGLIEICLNGLGVGPSRGAVPEDEPPASSRGSIAPAPAPATALPAITPPRPLSDTRVEYPVGGAGEAQVELELSIDAEGRVMAVRVIAGDAPFAEAARSAAEGWSFEPARRGGVAVAARIRFRVGFEQREVADVSRAIENPPEARGMANDGVAAGLVEPGGDLPGAVPSAEPQPPREIAITVTGARPAGARIISRAFARELPGAFGNPFAAIEASPGVTPTLSGAPYFYVRGAPPGNLGYFIDDIRLPTLFHVLAGPSVLHPGMVDSVDFHPGPYPARHGRFTGGIAAARIRRASYELHGEVSVRAFDSSALLEVPLVTGPAATSLTLAGRVAYANPIAHLFAPDVSVSYWDYQARLSHALSPRDELSALAFGSRDALDRERDDGTREVVFGAEFHRLQLRYQRALDAGSLRVMAVGGGDRSEQADGDAHLTNTTGRLRADLAVELGPGARLDAGLDLGLDRYSLELSALDDEDDRDDLLARYPTRLDSVAGGYVGAHLRLTPWARVELGTRLDVFGSKQSLEAALSPSVFAEFDITPRLTLIHALGLAHQPPSSDLPEPGANPVLGSGLQHALQSSAGLRLKLPALLRLEATLYQAVLFDLTDGIGISRIDNGDDEIEETSRALGSSRGLELLLEREFGHSVGGYVAYTLGSSRRSVGRAEGPALFDRRHVLSGAFSWRLGAGVRAGLRGTFYTGVPADVAYLAAARNPPRTSPFYRLDARLEKRWRLNADGAFWSIVLEVLNTTLHEEALGKSCSAYVCREDTVGPLTIPSLGLEAMF